jgi:hypothetical protein
MLKMSGTIKQQPFSPISYNTFPSDFFNNNNNHHHHHRQSTTSPENEQLSPAVNTTAESSSASTLVPSSAMGGGGGWYEKIFEFWYFSLMHQCLSTYLFTCDREYRYFLCNGD